MSSSIRLTASKTRHCPIYDIDRVKTSQVNHDSWSTFRWDGWAQQNTWFHIKLFSCGFSLNADFHLIHDTFYFFIWLIYYCRCSMKDIMTWFGVKIYFVNSEVHWCWRIDTSRYVYPTIFTSFRSTEFAIEFSSFRTFSYEMERFNSDKCSTSPLLLVEWWRDKPMPTLTGVSTV